MADHNGDDQLEGALDAGAPELYANSFANYLSNGDFLTLLVRNGRPTAIVNMSLPVAKTYATFVLKLIAEHEKATNREVDLLDQS